MKITSIFTDEELALIDSGKYTPGRAALDAKLDLAAALEREECAKVCEEVAVDSYTKIGMAHAPYMKATAEDCASHIRARGQV